MQFLQKTITYQPEEHADPCLLGQLKLMGPAAPIGTVKSSASQHGFVRRRETFTTTLEEGVLRDDWITFSLRDRDNADIFNQDTRITSIETMTIAAGDARLRQITLPNTLAYTFGIKTKLLSRDPRLELLGLKIPTRHSTLKIRDSLRNNVISKLELLFNTELEDQEFHMELTDLATTLISSTSLNEIYDNATSRSRIVARATEAIRHADPRILNPRVVAELAYTSVRTLEYAFQEVLQMTPKQYIDFYRINLLRERLIATPQIPIVQLGDEVGLPHLGNLSRNYKNLYGETPSNTKKRLANL
ncbi:MAG: AraC-like DNA-binding protein [Candidatus Azotimanducaceae bacterium]